MPIRPEMRERYPADWKRRSHFVRFVRARGCCEWCGVPHGWDVWRHPENPRGWYARREIGPGQYHCRTTFEHFPLASHSLRTLHGPVRIVLTCAHVYDHRPEAAGLLNLAALCQHCHNRHDAKHRAAGRKARRAQLSLAL